MVLTDLWWLLFDVEWLIVTDYDSLHSLLLPTFEWPDLLIPVMQIFPHSTVTVLFILVVTVVMTVIRYVVVDLVAPLTYIAIYGDDLLRLHYYWRDDLPSVPTGIVVGSVTFIVVTVTLRICWLLTLLMIRCCGGGWSFHCCYLFDLPILHVTRCYGGIRCYPFVVVDLVFCYDLHLFGDDRWCERCYWSHACCYPTFVIVVIWWLISDWCATPVWWWCPIHRWADGGSHTFLLPTATPPPTFLIYRATLPHTFTPTHLYTTTYLRRYLLHAAPTAPFTHTGGYLVSHPTLRRCWPLRSPLLPYTCCSVFVVRCYIVVTVLLLVLVMLIDWRCHIYLAHVTVVMGEEGTIVPSLPYGWPVALMTFYVTCRPRTLPVATLLTLSLHIYGGIRWLVVTVRLFWLRPLPTADRRCDLLLTASTAFVTTFTRPCDIHSDAPPTPHTTFSYDCIATICWRCWLTVLIIHLRSHSFVTFALFGDWAWLICLFPRYRSDIYSRYTLTLLTLALRHCRWNGDRWSHLRYRYGVAICCWAWWWHYSGDPIQYWYCWLQLAIVSWLIVVDIVDVVDTDVGIVDTCYLLQLLTFIRWAHCSHYDVDCCCAIYYVVVHYGITHYICYVIPLLLLLVFDYSRFTDFLPLHGDCRWSTLFLPLRVRYGGYRGDLIWRCPAIHTLRWWFAPSHTTLCYSVVLHYGSVRDAICLFVAVIPYAHVRCSVGDYVVVVTWFDLMGPIRTHRPLVAFCWFSPEEFSCYVVPTLFLLLLTLVHSVTLFIFLHRYDWRDHYVTILTIRWCRCWCSDSRWWWWIPDPTLHTPPQYIRYIYRFDLLTFPTRCYTYVVRFTCLHLPTAFVLRSYDCYVDLMAVINFGVVVTTLLLFLIGVHSDWLLISGTFLISHIPRCHSPLVILRWFVVVPGTIHVTLLHSR